MDELRWALLLLGAIVVLAVYVYSRRQESGRQNDGAPGPGGRAEPVITGEDLWGPDQDMDGTTASTSRPELAPPRDAARRATDSHRREPSLGSIETDADMDGVAESAPMVAAREHAGESIADMRGPRSRVVEPYHGAISTDQQPEAITEPPQIETAPANIPDAGPPINPDKIVAMRMAARAGKQMAVETVVLKLRELGLRHGKFGIFHRHLPDADGPPLFSVASMTEPGSFDLAKMRETQLPGVTLFMVLPGPVDPLQAFDEMVNAARSLAGALDGEMLDESGSTWSIQRERYIREELIRYRLQHPQR